MADTFTKDKRSEIMRQIRSKDTTPERKLRSALFKRGLRFRKNVKSMPGKPDIVLRKYRTVIFVHGCFWHVHDCKKGSPPKSNQSFWSIKLDGNKARDQMNKKLLESGGWKVIVIWQCQMTKHLDSTVDSIIGELSNSQTKRNTTVV